jgi:DeoR family transcriptional regulator, glycerol-3-phosphate regulon repressor
MSSSAAPELNQRQNEILELVRQQGFAAIEALSQHFGVTTQTIRRDINELCRHQLLRRYHGGAGLPSSVENLAYSARQVMSLAEKQHIARLVARHIPDQASLFITLGTTTEEIAKALNDHRGLRVITNNLHVATLMANYEDCEVMLTGGRLRQPDHGLTGESTSAFFSQFRADFGLISISGIDEDGTLLEFDYQEVHVLQSVMSHARKVWLAADHTKFGRNAVARLGHVRDVDALFTNQPPPLGLCAALAEAGTQLHVAKPDRAR